MDENAQVYFDLEDNIPVEDIERYKRAMSEEDVLAMRRVKKLVERNKDATTEDLIRAGILSP